MLDYAIADSQPAQALAYLNRPCTNDTASLSFG